MKVVIDKVVCELYRTCRAGSVKTFLLLKLRIILIIT